MHDELAKIDILRERTGVSYRKAKEALDAAGGDVVQALVALEDEQRSRRQRFEVRGSELVDKVKSLIREGTVRRIVIKSDDRTIFEIPVAVGAIGALLLPTLAALGVVAAMLTEASIIVERRGDDDEPIGGGSGAGAANGR
ncbi:MAG TPA: DUF4342 domain-containing protein [Bacillota bacterium]